MSNIIYKKGVSVVVCCYNSFKRISKTLLALARQQCDANILWEIIIVDNASTDNTSQVVSEIWEELNSSVSMRIVTETVPGLGNARIRGVKEARYTIILFCDDDNWLAENYVQGIFDIIGSDAMIGGCGGMGIPVFETEEPFWFYEYAESFALGSQKINIENNQVINLYGAGLAIKKNVFEELYNFGFQPVFTGRTAEKLSSSEDIELTNSFVLMGYKLVCCDDLKFFHFLPKERLTLEYLKKLFIAFGKDGPVRNLYYAHVSERFFHRYIKHWSLHFLLSLFRVVKYFIAPPKKYGRVIYLKWNLAYIKQLFSIRKKYDEINRQISRIKEIKNHKGLPKASKQAITTPGFL